MYFFDYKKCMGCVRFYVFGCFLVNISQCVHQEVNALWIRIGVPQNTKSWQILKQGVLKKLEKMPT